MYILKLGTGVLLLLGASLLWVVLAVQGAWAPLGLMAGVLAVLVVELRWLGRAYRGQSPWLKEFPTLLWAALVITAADIFAGRVLLRVLTNTAWMNEILAAILLGAVILAGMAMVRTELERMVAAGEGSGRMYNWAGRIVRVFRSIETV